MSGCWTSKSMFDMTEARAPSPARCDLACKAKVILQVKKGGGALDVHYQGSANCTAASNKMKHSGKCWSILQLFDHR